MICVFSAGFLMFYGIPYEYPYHVGADCISFAPTFFKSQSSFIPSLLLLSRDPLTLGSRLILDTVRTWSAQL